MTTALANRPKVPAPQRPLIGYDQSPKGWTFAATSPDRKRFIVSGGSEQDCFALISGIRAANMKDLLAQPKLPAAHPPAAGARPPMSAAQKKKISETRRKNLAAKATPTGEGQTAAPATETPAATAKTKNATKPKARTAGEAVA